MRKFGTTLTVAAVIFGTMAFGASAQTQSTAAAGLHAQIHNATPLQEAACRGFGPYCPPGTTRACNRWRCWCRPCW